MGGDTGLADMTFGSMAGMVAKVFEHPFDLVKVRLQSQPTDRPLSFTGPFDCFKQTYMKEGLRGLYRGISAPIAGAACENASLFLVYGKCQEAILFFRPRPAASAAGEGAGAGAEGRGLSIGELAVAGAGAGAVTSFVLTPIELIKCRMQVQMLAREGAFGAAAESASVAAAAAASSSSSSSAAPSSSSSSSRSFSTTSHLRQQLHAPPPGAASSPSGPLTLIMQTIRTSGVRGLWLGQTGTLFRETGGSAAWFGAYELSTRLWLKHYHHPTNPTATKADLTSLQLMASGALAGVSYNVILFPADSVKSTMQTWAELNPNSTQKASFMGTGRTIWRTRGIRGLYAGCGLTCLRSGPSSAMIFLIYQRLEQNFGYFFGLD